MAGSVLVVDTGSGFLAGAGESLRSQLAGWEVLIARSDDEGRAMIDSHDVDTVVAGPTFVAEVAEQRPGVARMAVGEGATRDELLAAAQTAQQVLSAPVDVATIAHAVRRVLAVRRKLDDPRLRDLIGKVDKLPALPDVYQRIRSVAAQPDFELRDIAAVIASDMATSAEVLKLVNSAGFGLSRSVVSVDEAVTMLGVQTVSALVLAGSMFRAGTLPAGLDAERMQKTAVAASAVARAVAVADGWNAHDADRTALAAMLRDVGLLVLAQGSPGSLVVLEEDEPDPVARAEREQRAFGCTVPAASAYLLGLWGFPQSVVHAVAAQPLVPGEPGASHTEQILGYACHRVLAGPSVVVPAPMLDPHRPVRWATSAEAALAGSDFAGSEFEPS